MRSQNGPCSAKKRPHLTGMYHNSEHRNHREYQKKFNELSER